MNDEAQVVTRGGNNVNDTTTPARPAKPRAHLCAADNCRILVLNEMYCWKHRAAKQPRKSEQR